MSAQDLTTLAGVNMQQDLALVSLLGPTHVDRNSHHFIDRMQTIWASSMIGSLNRSPIYLLHRAGQCAADVFQTEIADLTPRQLAVLMTVASDEGVNQTKLVDATGVDRSTLADIVRRLCRKDLLQRRRTREDACSYAVKLTDEGRRMLGVAVPAARRVDERVIGALLDKQREAFLTALASIVERLQSLTLGTPKTRRTSWWVTILSGDGFGQCFAQALARDCWPYPRC